MKLGKKRGMEENKCGQEIDNQQINRTPEQEGPEIAADNVTVDYDSMTVLPMEDAVDWQDKYVRLSAEFDNYRKRTVREKMELITMGGEEVIRALLPVVDDFGRALDAIEKSDDVEQLKSGITLISNKLNEVLRSRGVVEIEALGKELDTDLHEAIARFAAGEEQLGKIVDVAQKGYKLGEKVIRHAKVVVGE